MEEELARLAPAIEAHAACRERVEDLLAQVFKAHRLLYHSTRAAGAG